MNDSVEISCGQLGEACSLTMIARRAQRCHGMALELSSGEEDVGGSSRRASGGKPEGGRRGCDEREELGRRAASLAFDDVAVIEGREPEELRGRHGEGVELVGVITLLDLLDALTLTEQMRALVSLVRVVFLDERRRAILLDDLYRGGVTGYGPGGKRMPTTRHEEHERVKDEGIPG